ARGSFNGISRKKLRFGGGEPPPYGMNEPFPFNQPIGNSRRVGGVMTPTYAPSNTNLSSG
ncbi:hypothetical protein MR626_04055, partial [bacterium]|nr:hypothetical protein [bacterium]